VTSGFDPAAAKVASSGAIEHAPLRMLFDYWSSLAPDGAIPLKQTFDIVNVPIAAWPHMFMIDILEGERNYRVRVCGTYIVSVYNRDFTGRRLVEEEIPHTTESVTYELLGRLVRDRRPLHYDGPSSFRFSGFKSPHEQIMMPLSDDSGRIVAALGAVYYPGARPNHGYRF
jgi:hypothetical protein